MDKGYTDFNRLYKKIHKEQAFFVTRSKDNINFLTVEKQNVDSTTGVLDDAIRLIGYYSARKYTGVEVSIKVKVKNRKFVTS